MRSAADRREQRNLSRRIRIANVLPDVRLAGPVVRILSVAQGLKLAGVETVIVYPHDNGQFARVLDPLGLQGLPVSLARPRHPRNIPGNIAWLFRLPGDAHTLTDLLKRNSFNLIHCNGLLQITAPIAGRLSGVPVLWHMNDMMVPSIARLFLKPLVLRLSKGLVFASEAVKRQFGRLPEDLPSKIIYPPVDTRFFDPDCARETRNAIRSALGVGPRVPLVGMVANINRAKGVTDFVEAAGILQRRRSDVRFVHVGAPLETRMRLYAGIERRIKELGLNARLCLVGGKTNVRDYLAAMDVFVMPSISEAAGITLLEAMSMEKPIVATNVGGNPELVRDGREALLVPSRTPTAIAEKVAILLDAVERGVEMGRAARERAVRNFDLAHCVSMHENYYRGLLEIGCAR